MKTKTTFAALVAVAAIATAFPDSAFAQGTAAPQLSADHVAAQVQGFYDQTRTVQTAFYQAHYDRIYRRTTRSRGVLTIARPGKLRFDYLGGNGKVVVSNGSTFTVYEPGDDGEAGQYFQTPVAEEGIPSALAFLTGSARMESDFHYRLADAARFRWDGYVLELRPRVAEASYRRAFLYVDADPAAAGVVHRVLIQDHDGNLNRFDFQRMRFNRSVSAARFEFSPPAEARRL
ncbi:MAG: outer membrane lipoprotein carrier protein LolA [Sandaracinaceae bacterium]